jgi:uncharacterized protein (TIRG00374 family)
MKLRRFLVLLGSIGVVLVVATSLGSPAKIALAFSKVHWYVVPLMVACQLLSYYCNARYYQTLFAISHHEIPLRRLYEAALGINFANQAIPSGGVAGAAYLSQALKPYHVPPGQATLAQVGRYIFNFLSFFFVIAAGFVMLFFAGDLNKISVRIVILLMFIILAIGSVLLAVFAERRRMRKFLLPFARFINAFGRRILRRSDELVSEERLDRFLHEFYRSYHEIITKTVHWPKLLRWTLGGNICEVLTVYSVFVGFGYWVNPGIVITGYALAIMASIGGAFIAGLVVYEAGMIGTFAALGIPFALSFAVVVVYRVLSMGIFLPVGLYFYRRHLRS